MAILLQFLGHRSYEYASFCTKSGDYNQYWLCPSSMLSANLRTNSCLNPMVSATYETQWPMVMYK
jgi:hypothetical protein